MLGKYWWNEWICLFLYFLCPSLHHIDISFIGGGTLPCLLLCTKCLGYCLVHNSPSINIYWTNRQNLEWEKNRLPKQHPWPPCLFSPHLALAACPPCCLLGAQNTFHHGHLGELPLEQRHQAGVHGPTLGWESPSYVHLDRRYCRRTALQDLNLEFWAQVYRRAAYGILMALVLFSLKAPTVTYVLSLLPCFGTLSTKTPTSWCSVKSSSTTESLLAPI